jgi:hypothetical protein
MLWCIADRRKSRPRDDGNAGCHSCGPRKRVAVVYTNESVRPRESRQPAASGPQLHFACGVLRGRRCRRFSRIDFEKLGAARRIEQKILSRFAGSYLFDPMKGAEQSGNRLDQLSLSFAALPEDVEDRLRIHVGSRKMGPSCNQPRADSRRASWLKGIPAALVGGLGFAARIATTVWLGRCAILNSFGEDRQSTSNSARAPSRPLTGHLQSADPSGRNSERSYWRSSCIRGARAHHGALYARKASV